jgi:hypothetical protein
MTAQTAVDPVFWPTAPYKGLSFYGSGDAVLLAGRDDDVDHCSTLITHTATRILILHGLTGCGKSSFLRAGLIPRLEKNPVGFRFPREASSSGPSSFQSDSKALFIRCRSQPLETLAAAVLEFIDAGMTLDTPLGRRALNLKKALSGCINATQTELAEAPNLLLNVLERLSDIVPQTLTLVIDQAEEVLTLDQSPSGDEARTKFFEFLGVFSQTTIDLKLILAIRTEFYGRIYAKLRRQHADILGIREYFLDELTTEQLVQAILQPTSDTVIPGLGSPREHFRFTYEPGLPERIVQELNETTVAGGVLPVLQIVCATLWDRSRRLKPSPFRITLVDYQVLGGPAGQVEEHLDRILLFWSTNNKLSIDKALAEADRWKLVLNRLVRTQADGSVTTDIVTRSELVTDSQARYHCSLDPIGTLRYLAADQVRLLREVQVVDRRTRESILCYSLGHDTLGLVLRRWKLLRDNAAQSTLRLRNRFLRYGITLCVASGLAEVAISRGYFKNFLGPTEWQFAAVPALYGVLFMGLSLALRFTAAIPSPFWAKVTISLIRMFPPEFARLLLTNVNRNFLRAHPDVKRVALERMIKQVGLFGRIVDAVFSRLIHTVMQISGEKQDS